MAERNQHFAHPRFDELLEFIQQNVTELLESKICYWDEETEELIRRKRARYPDIPLYPTQKVKTKLQAPVIAIKAGRRDGEVHEEVIGHADAIVTFTRYSLVFFDPEPSRVPSWTELNRSRHLASQAPLLNDENTDEVSKVGLDSETAAEPPSPWQIHGKGCCALYIICCPEITSAGSILRELQQWKQALRDAPQECHFGVVSNSDRWKELIESQGFIYWHVTDDQLSGV